MKRKLIIGLASVGFAFLLAAISPLAFGPDRTTSAQVMCINNLRFMDGAKEQWAMDNQKTNGAVALEDILPYHRESLKRFMLHCPSSGTYTVGAVGGRPRCSIKGHGILYP